ncbi:hypothetical protein [Candidatus Sodalis sp. SoCistrobi]|uniref:carbapenem self-resistance protein CarG family protein n=1 Tax=Candidatus Sodalis sp. SoCistrobi TaxID=1922216 RepID=UPI000938DEAD
MRALLLALFVSVSATGANLTPVPLVPGGNQVDIDNNGKPDLVILGQFDNNHTHNCHGISFFIHHPDGGFSMVPVANSDKFVWLDNRLTASSAKVLVNRLFHDGRRYYLVKAQKYGANLYTLLPVKFTLYLLGKHQGEPGEPHYRWHAWRSFLSQQRYASVEESFAEIASLNPDIPEKRYVAPLPEVAP